MKTLFGVAAAAAAVVAVVLTGAGVVVDVMTATPAMLEYSVMGNVFPTGVEGDHCRIVVVVVLVVSVR